MLKKFHELARCNYTIAWFLQSITEVIQVQTKSIRIFVLQDAPRCACYDTDSNEHIQAYSRCLNQIVLQLGISENIILTSHEQLEEKYPHHQDLQMFIERRREVYSEKFQQFSKPFFQAKSDLMRCTTRRSFLCLVDKLSLNSNISQLIELISHSRYHLELTDVQLSPSDELKILAQIYQPVTTLWCVKSVINCDKIDDYYTVSHSHFQYN